MGKQFQFDLKNLETGKNLAKCRVTSPDAAKVYSHFMTQLNKARSRGLAVAFDPVATSFCAMDGDSRYIGLVTEVDAPVPQVVAPVSQARSVCMRCRGLGWIAHYAHVEMGVCFSCYGNGEALTKDEHLAAKTEYMRTRVRN